LTSLVPVRIVVEDNPNCAGCGEIVFTPIEASKPIGGLIASGALGDEPFDIVGVEPDGKWIPAYAQKVADSGDGTAFLIYGGTWGIRMRPRKSAEPWNFSNPQQIGESHKLYGSWNDILEA